MNEKKITEISSPKQWKNLPISKLLEFGYPVYGANGIIGYYNEYNHEKSTLAITCRGATCGSIHLTKPKSYITSNAMALDDLDESECNIKYLALFLKYRGFNDVISGSAQPQITRTNLERIKVPLPLLDDQIRIATLLSRVETLIATRKGNLRLLDEFVKSTFLEMFGPTNPDFNSWPLTEIKELAADHKGAMRTGPFGSNLLHKEFTESGDVAVLGIDNAVQNTFAWGRKRFITKEKYENLKNYRIFPRDVIITIMGTIGRSAVVPDDIPLAINTKHLAAITLDKKKQTPNLYHTPSIQARILFISSIAKPVALL